MATQTQQTTNNSILAPVVQSQVSQNQQIVDTNLIPPLTTKSASITPERSTKKSNDKSRKEKNRYSSLRQAPAGQQQQSKLSSFTN